MTNYDNSTIWVNLNHPRTEIDVCVGQGDHDLHGQGYHTLPELRVIVSDNDITAFKTGAVLRMLPISRRTLYRWTQCGKIKFERMSGGHMFFRLFHINIARSKLGLPPLSKEQALELWKDM